MTSVELVGAAPHHPLVTDPWNPWRALRHRPHITFTLDDIAHLGGGAIYARRGDRAAIVIDPDLGRRDRNAALAHELVHDERGGIEDHPDAPTGWAPVVVREEATVDRIVADRLVPTAALAEFVDRCLSTDEPVTPRLVAEEFDVPEHVAHRALCRLTENAARRHPSGGNDR